MKKQLTLAQKIEVLAAPSPKLSRLNYLIRLRDAVEYGKYRPIGVDFSGCMIQRDLDFRLRSLWRVKGLEYCVAVLKKEKTLKMDMSTYCRYPRKKNRNLALLSAPPDYRSAEDTIACGTSACLAGSVVLSTLARLKKGYFPTL